MDRQHAHQLLDQLDSAQFTAVARILEVMTGQSLLHARAEAPEAAEINADTATT